MTIFRNNATSRANARRPMLAASVFSLLAGTGPVRADQIVVGGENYTKAEVVNLSGGMLQFRGQDGTVRRVHPADVDLMVIERGGLFDDFNEAERLLDAGEPGKAAVRYERALRLSSDSWSDLILARLVVAYDRAMQVDKAVRSLIQVTRGQWGGPVVAARLIPQNLPAQRTGALARAVRELDVALSAHPQSAQRMIFEVARYTLLRRMDDDRAASAAVRIATHRIPEEIRSRRLFEIVVSATGEALAGDPVPGVTEGLERAIAACPDEFLPDFLLLEGDARSRTASRREDLIRATWPFLRVAIHMPTDPRAVRGLLGAARILRQLDNPSGARKLLEECLASANAEEADVNEARRLLDALDADQGPGEP